MRERWVPSCSSAVVTVVAPGGTATRCFVAETARGGGCDES